MYVTCCAGQPDPIGRAAVLLDRCMPFCYCAGLALQLPAVHGATDLEGTLAHTHVSGNMYETFSSRIRMKLCRRCGRVVLAGWWSRSVRRRMVKRRLMPRSRLGVHLGLPRIRSWLPSRRTS